MRPLRWYWRRARAMSPGELAASHAGRRLRDALGPGPPRVPSSLSLRVEPVSAASIQEFGGRFPQAAAHIVDTAERAIDGTVFLFGRARPVGRPIDWHLDPHASQAWPRTARINLTSLRRDPRPVWELNRHRWLPDLALAYRLTGDERFAREALSCIDSWIEQNAWRTGINWTAPTELAIRQISWLWVVRLLESTAALSDAARRRIAASIYCQGACVAAHLSVGSSANNHLVAEAAGLLLSGHALGIERWRRLGDTILGGQIGRLVCEDGTGAEQSVGYLVQTVEYYLLALKVSPRLGDDAVVRQRLGAAARFLSALTVHRPTPPAIGDDDSGEVFSSLGAYPRVASVINSLAEVSGQPELRRPDWRSDSRSFWLGLPGELRDGDAGRPAAPDSFTEGGYYRLDGRQPDGGVALLFDCGPLGLAPLAGHAHCDALSVTVWQDGVELLTDSGTCTFRAADGWRSYFRGTTAHSTVRVDGAEQSVYDGPFLVARRADARCVDWQPGATVAGEIQLAAGVRHRRRVTLVKGGTAFEITDELEGRGPHLAEIFFHAPPSATVRLGDDGRVSVAERGRSLTVCPPAACSSQLYFGDSALPLGWFSRGYGERQPCFSLVSRIRFREAVTLVTVLEMGQCAA